MKRWEQPEQPNTTWYSAWFTRRIVIYRYWLIWVWEEQRQMSDGSWTHFLSDRRGWAWTRKSVEDAAKYNWGAGAKDDPRYIVVPEPSKADFE